MRTRRAGDLHPDARAVGLGSVAVLIAVTAADLATGRSPVLTGLLVVAPLLACMRTPPPETAAVGAVAFALAIALGAINGVLGDDQQIVGSIVVLAGSALATWIAVIRARLEDAELAARHGHDVARKAASRARFLAGAGAAMESSLNPEETLGHVASLAIPELADLCVIDLVHGERIEGVSIAAVDPDAAERLRALRASSPVDPDSEHPVARVLRNGRSQLLATISEDRLARVAQSEEHRRFMHAAQYRSAVVVPLRARHRTLGVISLIRFLSSAPYTAEDVVLVEDMARSAALALDNARLFFEVEEAERQVTAILRGVREAVFALATDGTIVYANALASELLGTSGSATAVGASVAEVLEKLELHDEHGARLAPEQLPWNAAAGGEAQPPMTIRIAGTDGDRWAVVRSTPVREAIDGPAMTVNVLEDVTEAKRAELAQRFLADATRTLAASLDYRTTLEQVARLAVPAIADWCAVELPNERGELEQVALAHADPALLAAGRRLRERFPVSMDSETGAPAVIRTGVSEAHTHITDELVRERAAGAEQAKLLIELGLRSALVVPIAVGQRILGAISLVSSRADRPLGADALAVAEELGRRAGTAIENSRLYTEQAWVAHTLQASLLPPQLPEVPGLRVATRFRAAGEGIEVGGDFYDLFPVEGGWMVVIGDVTGKGPKAAALTSLARHAIRTVAFYEPYPATVLARLNAILLDQDRPAQLCSALCAHASVTPHGVAVRMASGGHPLPLRLNAGGEVEEVGEPGTLLGAAEDGAWPEVELTLAPQELVVLYTDGVTDASRGRERFGSERLRELVVDCHTRSAEQVAARLDDALREWERDSQRDDVALVVIEARPDDAQVGADVAGARRPLTRG